MNRIGSREDISISGSVFLYSGPPRGPLGALLRRRSRLTELGLMRSSFGGLPDADGLVTQYAVDGVWKLRFLEIAFDADGFTLAVYRPREDGGASPTSPGSSPREPSPHGGKGRKHRVSFTERAGAVQNALLSDPMQHHIAENRLFKQQIESGKAHQKAFLRLGEGPLKLRCVRPAANVAPFLLALRNGFTGEGASVRYGAVVQLLVEGGALEFVARDDASTLRWHQRLQTIVGVHGAFLQVQRALLSHNLFPVAPGREEFPIGRTVVEASGGRSNQVLLCKMAASYAKKGVDVSIVGRSVAGDVHYWRLLLDEPPLINDADGYAELRAVSVAQGEVERLSVATEPADEAFLAAKPVEYLRVLRTGSSSLYYLTKWVNFVSVFSRLFTACHPAAADRWVTADLSRSDTPPTEDGGRTRFTSLGSMPSDGTHPSGGALSRSQSPETALLRVASSTSVGRSAGASVGDPPQSPASTPIAEVHSPHGRPHSPVEAPPPSNHHDEPPQPTAPTSTSAAADTNVTMTRLRSPTLHRFASPPPGRQRANTVVPRGGEALAGLDKVVGAFEERLNSFYSLRDAAREAGMSSREVVAAAEEGARARSAQSASMRSTPTDVVSVASSPVPPTPDRPPTPRRASPFLAHLRDAAISRLTNDSMSSVGATPLRPLDVPSIAHASPGQSPAPVVQPEASYPAPRAEASPHNFSSPQPQRSTMLQDERALIAAVGEHFKAGQHKAAFSAILAFRRRYPTADEGSPQ